MSDAPILASGSWPTNAELIADVAKLYLDESWRILDPTHGKGIWWKKWRPRELVTHDIRQDGVDFRSLPHRDAEFDAVAFDPPYVCVGGRKTTTIEDMHDRYGLTDAPKSPAELQDLINAGLAECLRVCKPGRPVLVKVQDYVSSGKLWIGTHHTLTHALKLGATLTDRFEHVTSIRPQPPGRRQVHARRNLSTLCVFAAPKRDGQASMF